MNDQTYWMVHCIERPNESYIASFKHEAIDACKRLAQEYPGETFYVMESITAFCAKIPEPERVNLHHVSRNASNQSATES